MFSKAKMEKGKEAVQPKKVTCKKTRCSINIEQSDRDFQNKYSCLTETKGSFVNKKHILVLMAQARDERQWKFDRLQRRNRTSSQG